MLQSVFDYVDEFWPEIAALQRELTGVAPQKVEALPIATRFGSIRGGYFPLIADTQQKGTYTAYLREATLRADRIFESNWTMPVTKHGHTIERVGFAGQKVKLSLSVLSDHVHNVIHDLTHRKAIMEVDRLTRDPEVRSAIEDVAGVQAYRQIRPWLKSIAGDQIQPTFLFEKAFAHARHGAAIVYMGLKFTVAFAQLAGYSNSAGFVGAGPLARSMYDFVFARKGSWQEQIEFVKERSSLIRNRPRNWDRDARDTMQKAGRSVELKAIGFDRMTFDMKQTFFKFIAMMDLFVSVPTWFAAYRTEMEATGNEERAIQLGDRAVRVSQGTGAVKDLARVQRGPELVRMFTLMYGYFSVAYNQLARAGRLSKTASIPDSAVAFFWFWVGPALIAEALANRGPEDDEAWWKWAAIELGRYPFQTVVGVRDGFSWLFSTVFEDKHFDLKLTPVADAFTKPFKASAQIIDDIAEGELRRSTKKQTFEALGFWAHFPSRQAWITGEAIHDWITDDADVEPLDFLFVRPPERRVR